MLNSKIVQTNTTNLKIFRKQPARLGSDRLQRFVRSYPEQDTEVVVEKSSAPGIYCSINIGDWCLFSVKKDDVRVGQVLGFQYKTPKGRYKPYKLETAPYWEVLAEKRRAALEESLSENMDLYEQLSSLKEELSTSQQMLQESRNIVEVLTELLQEDEAEKELRLGSTAAELVWKMTAALCRKYRATATKIRCESVAICG
ncbi:hypothetical protein pipiens_015822 [Culex pipiens pipiens]|uniref:Uncharacterized protein n=1 Tax=Culex pipiens pipiens TaxID=38569 RepID=A0ABD1CNV4_CULPP